MPGPDRDEVLRDFIEDRVQVVVATNAFGMGIDRADVRAIAHRGPPCSVEAYYQEVWSRRPRWRGRLVPVAGLPGDMALRRRLIESDSDGRTTEQAVVQHKWNLLN